jgi:hypothetical protein
MGAAPHGGAGVTPVKAVTGQTLLLARRYCWPLILTSRYY